MLAHRIDATFIQDGSLTLDALPFHAGEEVEIIILAKETARPGQSNPYPLRGTRVHYERPLEPVAEDDWAAVR